jgi:transcriptional regulator with XRE-family HTH domain
MPIERSQLLIERESVATDSTTRSELLASLRTSKEYRHAFTEESIRSRLTAQIRGIREQRRWDYKAFAKELDRKLAWAYRLEDPNETLPTIPTLLEVAEAFDIALDVRFLPFSKFLDDVSGLSPASFTAEPFIDDAGLIERKPVARDTGQQIPIYDTNPATGTASIADANTGWSERHLPKEKSGNVIPFPQMRLHA